MAGTLTRSRIEAFDQTANQLSQYATQWRTTASELDQAAQGYVSQIANPSGTQWQGQASAAALDAAHSDQVSVTGAVMHVHEMADAAEAGSNSLLGAREGALEAISAAEADNFTVGEDLSVADNHSHTDPATYAARMSQAQAHLGYIEHHAGLLEAENERVATQLGAGASQMGGMVPATWKTNGGHGKPEIQLVDNTTDNTPQLPRHDPPIGRWDGKPPPGWHEGTGYWAVDTDHPMDGPNGAHNPSLYQSDPPCVDRRALTGPPTGLQSVVGDGGSDNPAKQRATGFDMQGTSKVRIVGTEFNGTTQMVQMDGHWYQAQWQEYQYQVNTIPVMNGLGKFGGITLPEMSQANAWQPVSLGELMQKSATYPEATFYLPNPLQGGNIELQNGWWKGGIPSTGIPTPPIMTRGN